MVFAFEQKTTFWKLRVVTVVTKNILKKKGPVVENPSVRKHVTVAGLAAWTKTIYRSERTEDFTEVRVKLMHRAEVMRKHYKSAWSAAKECAPSFGLEIQKRSSSWKA